MTTPRTKLTPTAPHASGQPPHTAQSTAEAVPESILSVRGVQIGYRLDRKMNIAVENVGFDAYPGETIILLGPSGCGKSTLLKAVAGFLEPVRGQILVRGRATSTPGPDRAVVFQEFDQLFPWRTVLDNVSYPLRRNGRARTAAEHQARHYLDLMGLSEALHKYPHHLSGGMKQRVSIARALALEPVMLLMDEPFGALDALTRARLQRELNAIAELTGVTILFVTHSIEEAIVLGDRVVVLGEPPSTVRDIVHVTPEAKTQDSQEYLAVRRRLHSLLSNAEDHDDSAEDHDDTAFYE